MILKLDNSAQIFNLLSDIPGEITDADELLEVCTCTQLARKLSIVAVASPFACCCRVTSRDSPKWRVFWQAIMYHQLISQSPAFLETFSIFRRPLAVHLFAQIHRVLSLGVQGEKGTWASLHPRFSRLATYFSSSLGFFPRFSLWMKSASPLARATPVTD